MDPLMGTPLIALDPYLLRFLDGNAITLTLLASLVKSWAVISRKAESNKISELFLALFDSLLSIVPGKKPADKKPNGG